ncbi:hypothetical protein [Streptomyces sp. N35]|uniref:hypothetical protein n=1 Tax=Streptomyces sp. N35 TaxID=2795730 RepID=UPI0018F4C967|nr:hypothetical protein [Streptomyces sp. N35]
MSLGGGYDDDRPGPEDDVFYGGTGTTRTRLPEGDGDGYGAPRRPARASRSLVTVVGVVVLLIAAIAFANQGGEDGDGGGSGGSKPGANPTAASGEDAVGTKDGGIPVGFKQSRTGVQSAAANYAVALGSYDMFEKDKRRNILAVVMAPQSVQRFEESLDKAYSADLFKNLGLNQDGTTPKGFTFVSRTTPIGTKVTSYSNDKATVEVWCSGLLGLAGEGSTNPVTSDWFTITMELEWVEGGHWQAVTHSQKAGPTPVPGDDRASGADDIADAVEQYGGFTYAR